MIFETDILTLMYDRDLCSYEEEVLCFYGEKKEVRLQLPAGGRSEIFSNEACFNELNEHYKLPSAIGTQIVIVFSDSEVDGAETVLGSTLLHAGLTAAIRAGFDIDCINDTKFWWWVEEVY